MTNWQRYKILSTYDLEKIERLLGEHYTNLGKVYRAATEAYNQLNKSEKALDYWEASQELEALGGPELEALR